jgi:TRAP-type C4-dicarboxylate transport system permease small subunit
MDRMVRIVDLSVGALAFIGGAVILVGMALLTVLDVVLRQFGAGVPGSWEMVTFAMRWMIGLSLPYAFWTGRHVAVEAFTDMLPARLRQSLILVAQMLGAVVMGVMTWRLNVRGTMILDQGVRTSDLGILTYYHWLPLIGGAAISCIVLILLCLRDTASMVRGPTADRASR